MVHEQHRTGQDSIASTVGAVMHRGGRRRKLPSPIQQQECKEHKHMKIPRSRVPAPVGTPRAFADAVHACVHFISFIITRRAVRFDSGSSNIKQITGPLGARALHTMLLLGPLEQEQSPCDDHENEALERERRRQRRACLSRTGASGPAMHTDRQVSFLMMCCAVRCGTLYVLYGAVQVQAQSGTAVSEASGLEGLDGLEG